MITSNRNTWTNYEVEILTNCLNSSDTKVQAYRSASALLGRTAGACSFKAQKLPSTKETAPLKVSKQPVPSPAKAPEKKTAIQVEPSSIKFGGIEICIEPKCLVIITSKTSITIAR